VLRRDISKFDNVRIKAFFTFTVIKGTRATRNNYQTWQKDKKSKISERQIHYLKFSDNLDLSERINLTPSNCYTAIVQTIILAVASFFL
tara:strand:+ start:495 stop:761 length:267 start_codon:yes stop_codon:yes gene_type:complete